MEKVFPCCSLMEIHNKCCSRTKVSEILTMFRVGGGRRAIIGTSIKNDKPQTSSPTGTSHFATTELLKINTNLSFMRVHLKPSLTLNNNLSSGILNNTGKFPHGSKSIKTQSLGQVLLFRPPQRSPEIGTKTQGGGVYCSEANIRVYNRKTNPQSLN